MKASYIDSQLSQKIWDHISAAERIILLAHSKPDGDTLSSCAALSHVLTSLGKTVETVYPGGPCDPVVHQPKPLHNNTHSFTPDLVISCDVATPSRMYYPDEFRGIPFIVIDHHVGNDIECDISLIKTEASSTCEIVYHLLESWNQKIDTTCAEALLFGILCDSQSFTTSSTTSDTLHVASKLSEYGANIYDMNKRMIVHDNPYVVGLWGYMMSNARIYSGTPNAIMALCTQDLLKSYEVDETALIGFIDFMSRITTVDVSLLFYELSDGTSKISMRSKETDVNAIARSFGGGGHTHAAGIASSKPLEELAQEFVNAFGTQA